MIDVQHKQMFDRRGQIEQDVKEYVISEQKRLKKKIKQTARKMIDMDGFKSAEKKDSDHNIVSTTILKTAPSTDEV